MVAVCKDFCVSAPLRFGVKICRAEIKGSGRAAAGGARPSPAAAMSRRQRAFANPMPDGFATLLRPGTGALRRLVEPFRLGKRQPGRARSPAKSQPCGQWQFGVDEWGKRVLNLKNMPTTLKLKFMGDGTAFNSHRAWIVLGDHAIDNGEHLLSADCVTASQVEEAAQYLKKQLDEIVSSAKRKFPK